MTTVKVKGASARTAQAAKAAEHATTPAEETVEAAEPAEVSEKVVHIAVEQVQTAAKVQAAAFQTSVEDAVALAKDNVEAVVKAGTILSKGLQDIGRDVLGLAQASIEESVSASKAVFGVKTLRELFDLQSNLVKANLDKLMSESTRLSDQSVKLVEEAFAPIQDRVNATVDRLVKAA
jgi:phasin family protein